MPDNEASDTFFGRIRDNISGALITALVGVAGTALLTGMTIAYTWTQSQVVAAAVADLQSGKDSKLAPVLAELVSKQLGTKESSLRKIASDLINDELSSIIGFSIGEQISLSPENPVRSFPLIVPPGHRAWLVYSIQTVADVKQVTANIKGFKFEEPLKTNGGTEVLELTPAINAVQAGSVMKIFDPDGKPIVIEGDKKSVPVKAKNNFLSIGFAISEADRRKLTLADVADKRLTLSYVVLVGKSFPIRILDD